MVRKQTIQKTHDLFTLSEEIEEFDILPASPTMAVTETQQRHLAIASDDGRTATILSSPNISPRTSITIPVSEPFSPGPRTPRTAWKTKDDIRFYFRPLPREDIRVYFRPVSRVMIDRPRPSKAKVVPNAGKVKVRSRMVSLTDLSPSLPGPEVPPKAKARTSGQKNRDVFLAKQQLTNEATPGQTNQAGSAALPGFDPSWTNNQSIAPTDPLSPRITEVVDSSLLPPPLRNKSEAATSAPEYDDRTEKQKYQPALEVQPAVEYQQTIVQEYQQTTLPPKPNSIYGTLPPLPIRLQRNNSQPAPQSPRKVRHRRQDTPYSPDDVGNYPAPTSPAVPARTPSTSDLVGRTSVYASSDALPTSDTLEEWASERRRIAHGQPATTHVATAVDADKAKEIDRTLKKTKSMEKRLFRSKKGKSEKDKDKEKIDQKETLQVPDRKRITSQANAYEQASRLAWQDLHHPGTRWDVGSLPPSPELIRPAIATASSDMNNNPRSDSVSDKMVVDPRLIRAQSDEISIVTTTAKLKKRNKLVRMLEAYSKNVEGLQMVQ